MVLFPPSNQPRTDAVSPLTTNPTQVHRYIFNARVMDESGELTLQVYVCVEWWWSNPKLERNPA